LNLDSYLIGTDTVKRAPQRFEKSLGIRLIRCQKTRVEDEAHPLVKVSVNRFVLNRVLAIRNDVEAEVRRLRNRTLDRLEEIFNVAVKVVGGETKHQRIHGKMVPIKLNQRRRWLRVAEHVALSIRSIASNIDEKEIRAQLNTLEKLVDEARAIDQPQNEKE
jgi:hypothetical protein